MYEILNFLINVKLQRFKVSTKLIACIIVFYDSTTEIRFRKSNIYHEISSGKTNL